MDGILRALGFDSKPEYAERIPETLKASDFNVHETFHHGFPSQPTVLDYDPILQLLAIGTETGAILLLGKPGLERYFSHPSPTGITMMRFIVNKGYLVTLCDNGMLYLWSIKEQVPQVLHTLEFVKENDRPSCISSHYKSDWLYVGSENGNIYLVNVPSFKVSGYIIYWNHIIGPSMRGNPGRVLCVMEHPLDQGKIFIAYTGGHCVLYNLKQHESTYNLSMSMDSRMAPDHKYFLYDPGDNHIITSVDWVNSGRQVACSYSDGSIVVWNTKTEAKPEKIFTLHDCDPTQFRPIYKMQVVQTESDPLYLCSGGFPEKSTEAPRTLTVMQGKSISMLTSSSTIIDFLSLSSSPHPSDCQKPFALVILAKNEMIIHDMTTPGYPKFPRYSLPYALDIHLPAVTHIFYSANCPEEFIAQLHSVKSKMMAPSTKPWPLHGGIWGEEVPHSTTDIIVTGHTDGSVRLWHCNSVIFQPFFTIDTSRYFKQRASQSPSKSHLDTKQTSTPSSISRPPPPSHPPPKPRKSPSNAAETPIVVEGTVEVGTEEKDEEETSSKHEQSSSERTTPDQQQQQHSESTDGSSADKSPEVVERRTISYNDKKSRRKKKAQSLEVITPITPSAHEHEKRTLNFKSFRKMAKLVKTSQSVSIRNSIAEEDADGVDEVFEEEKEEESKKDGDSGNDKRSKSPPKRPPPPDKASPISPMSTMGEGDQQQKPRKKRPPPRPSNIAIRQQEVHEQQQLSTGVTPGSVTFALGEGEGTSRPSKRNKRPVPQPNLQEDSSTRSSRSTPPHDVNHSPCRLTTRSQFSRAYLEADNEYFVINYIHMCVCGLWLCVANEGGNVLAFDFSTTPQDHSTGVLDVNFDYDSVRKQYVSLPPTVPGETSSPLQAPPNIAEWIYNDEINDSSSGYQLTQLCQCFSTRSPSPAPSPSSGAAEQHPVDGEAAATPAKGLDDKQKVPATVNTIQYSTVLRILVIGTRRGLAIVDAKNNSCVYILSSCTSILYLSDPSKFTNQMRKESKQPGLAAHPSIKRHGTIIRFSDTKRQSSMSLKSSTGVGGRTSSHPTLPVQAGSRMSLGSVSSPMDDRDEGCTAEVSVELDSCVSSMELVQLQLDKTSPPTPTLTLWVGLAAGHVASYVVSIPRTGSKRVELHPTRLICETKTPIVNIFFLNEWGDCQVVPYRPNNTLSVGEKRELLNSPQFGRKAKATTPSSAPLHYSVIVDEQKLRAFSFPGFNKIAFVNPPIVEGNVILRSEYFTCNALPCLATITSCQKLLIHTLPGLKLMVSHVFSPLGDPLATGTFRASGNGLGLYMPSPSEIQRMSIVRNDMLNYPGCLPSVFTERSDISPSSYGKGFLGMLGITGNPVAINREDLFGKVAARPIGNLVRLDGQVVRAYGNKELRSRHRDNVDGQAQTGNQEKSGHKARTERGGGGGGEGGGGGAGLSNQMNRNLVSLDERKKKLTAIEDRTAKVAVAAASYADLCTQLAQKHKHDRK